MQEVEQCREQLPRIEVRGHAARKHQDGLDGGQHADQVNYDERRTQYPQAMGYRVLRFWNNDALVNIESVLTVILDALASPAPHPNPLPAGERGSSAPESEE